MSRVPNLFIVGAAKCGTTALARYLAMHPDIFAPVRKEFGFFSTDLHHPFGRMPRDAYLAYFADWSSERYALDATPIYLGSAAAPKEIARASTDPRIIIMVRNPVDMVYSLYYQLRYAGSEDAATFEEALALEPKRARGENLPPHMRTLENHLYTYQATFTEKIKRYQDQFGIEHCHIIVYDDFKADAADVFAKVQSFLQLTPISLATYPVVNPNKAARIPFLNQYIEPPKPWMKAIAGLILNQTARDHVRRFILQANSKPVARPPLAPDTAARLRELFAPDVHKLSDLLQRDLSHWVATER